jgi:hypothetical protein
MVNITSQGPSNIGATNRKIVLLDFPGFEDMGVSLILFLLNQPDPSSLEIFPLNISSSSQIKEIEPLISLDTAPHPIKKYHGQPIAAFVKFEEYLTPGSL